MVEGFGPLGVGAEPVVAEVTFADFLEEEMRREGKERAVEISENVFFWPPFRIFDFSYQLKKVFIWLVQTSFGLFCETKSIVREKLLKRLGFIFDSSFLLPLHLMSST